jgi:hypothetical protein
MSEKPSFFFEQFVPGFDFLKNLATGAAAGMPGAGAMPGISTPPGLSSWVAPTLSVEEVDKRIQEMRAVQFWLEQNLHALKATIQALEVQKMTLSTLRGMNLQMDDLAKAFTAGVATPPAAQAEKSGSERAATDAARTASAAKAAGGSAAQAQPEEASTPSAAAAGLVDPMKLWGALAEQFQQIATTALQEASNIKMPAMPKAAAAKTAASTPAKAPAKKAAARKARPASAKKPAAKKARSAAGRRQVL